MAQQIADRRDIDFVLHEQLNVEQFSQSEQYEEFNKKTVDLIVSEARNLAVKEVCMIAVAFFFLYLAVAKGYEPLLLLPIGFGIFLVNFPLVPLMGFSEHGTPELIRAFYKYGVEWEIIPCVIFLGLGAMTDFGPLIANPKTLIIGAGDAIGSAIVRQFATQGLTVCAARRNGDRLAPLVQELTAAGQPAHAFSCDARREEAVTELFAAYLDAPRQMPDDYADAADLPRAVADYIAGMTDRFALREHHRLTGRRLFAD